MTLRNMVGADAICINQASATEKSEQVQLMGTIYWRAARVNVWLGPHEEEHEIALEMINTTLDRHVKGTQDEGRKSFFSRKSTRPKKTSGYAIAPHQYTAEDLISSNEDQMKWEAIRRFLDLTWFKRVWVVQEVGLNLHTVFYCGDFMLPGARLEAFLNWMKISGGPILQYFPISWQLHEMVQSYREATGRLQRQALPRPTIAANPTQTDLPEDESLHEPPRLPTFLDVLDRARGLQCSNLRDAVYAFLGHPHCFPNPHYGP